MIICPYCKKGTVLIIGKLNRCNCCDRDVKTSYVRMHTNYPPPPPIQELPQPVLEKPVIEQLSLFDETGLKSFRRHRK